MRIDILSKTTLKLTLTADDMNNYDLCYEAFSEHGSDCRKTLGRLLKQAEEAEAAAMAARLLSEERRLFVEAFRRMDGGCMLYVSALNGHKRKKTLEEDAAPILFEAADLRDLGNVCRCLIALRERGARFSSRLFTDGACFRLELIPQNTCRSRVIRLFGEYGNPICDELTAAYTAEHCRVVIGEDAADIGAKIF